MLLKPVLRTQCHLEKFNPMEEFGSGFVGGGGVSSSSTLTQVIRLTGLLFARPENKLAREEILSSLSYFDERSGDHVNVYCPGYSKSGAGTVIAEVSGVKWTFSVPRFNEIRKQLESQTKWRYSGGVDLILLNARTGSESDKEVLDFSSVVSVNFEKLKQEKAIDSVQKFFEQIFQYAERCNGTDPAWGVSDRFGGKLAGSAFKQLILSLLPKPIRKQIEQAFNFAVTDISNPMSDTDKAG
jgi:hypothetical protein